MTNDSKEIVFRDSNLVSKANSIIEATYKLGVIEQKIISTIASNIHPTDKDFQTYTFSIKEFTELIGSKSKNMYGEVEKIVRKLMQPFNFINAEGKLTTIAWLSKATYNTSEGSVTIRFDPDLKPFFLFLNEKFTRYRLGNIIHLRSSYSIRLYELLKSYEGLTERTFTLDDLKQKLGIEDKYPKWINLRQRVLDHAQQELKEKTDIAFTYEPIKKGRSIYKIKFKISKNAKMNQPLIEIEEQLEKVVENDDVIEIQTLGKQMGLNISEKIVLKWLAYEKENVIELMKSIQYKDHITNPIGYISAVLPKVVEDEEEEKKMDTVSLINDAIGELIAEHIPKQKVKRLELLPEWFLKEDAMKKLQVFLSKEEAAAVWKERKEEVLLVLSKKRKKMLV